MARFSIGTRLRVFAAFLLGLAWNSLLSLPSLSPQSYVPASLPSASPPRPPPDGRLDWESGVVSLKPPAFFRALREEIDALDPAARCLRYGFSLGAGARRRIFFGSLAADEPRELFEIAGAEAFGLYAGIVLVESNRTQTFAPRAMRHWPRREARVARLAEIFGLGGEAVRVERYVNERNGLGSLDREHDMRRDIPRHWKRMGMRPEDVGIVSDVDEVLTRDFLQAIRTCGVINQLDHESHGCHPQKMGLRAVTQVFEGSPECATDGRQWYHPSVFSGHCLEHVADPASGHRPPPREEGGRRREGWSPHGWNHSTPYMPLADGGDFRRAGASLNVNLEATSAEPQDEPRRPYKTSSTREYNRYTAYHFHNWFADAKALRFKYRTYGHPIDNADVRPLETFHEDVSMMVRCARDEPDLEGSQQSRVAGGFERLNAFTPIYFRDAEYRRRRHALLQRAVAEDEAAHPREKWEEAVREKNAQEDARAQNMLEQLYAMMDDDE